MNIVILAPWLFAILVLIFFWTQIIWPTVQGKQLFPVFKRESRLLDALKRKEQEKAEEKLVKRLLEP